ncbi:MAG TPA: ribonuclease HII [Acetivibrio sp.]|nr:ribonuclease HII [Acetivibrio sp.]HPT90272.1 ribonuclease HII [Acetivibrio sp.]HQA57544.1 ribonuclease HII [Acetivibrio sp.]
MEKKMTLKQIEQAIKELSIDEAIERLNLYKEEYGDKINSIIEKYEKKKEKQQEELNRYRAMCSYEDEAYEKGYEIIAGIDEAGRGPLAGPVVAAAVILRRGSFIEGLNDSKKLTPQKRDKLYDIIMKNALSVGVGIVDEKIIDEINILNATKVAMKQAIEKLIINPDILLTDAVKLPEVKIPQISIVKGDAKSVSIAAASVIAKVTRDRFIEKMDSEYPQYGFSKHKGYGTKEHIEAIKKYGICPIHRVSFTKNFVG